ncbi:14472_t:CDS:2, partial [Rhizophagus irregularis]
ILSVLKSLQEDMASVRARIHALELADQRMSRLELRVFGHMQDDVLPPDPNDSSHMLPFSGPVLPPPMVPVSRSTISSSPIPETADEATINKERAEIYSFQRSLDNKFDHLSGSINRFISSISGGSSSDL